jgi:hypothetical protein
MSRFAQNALLIALLASTALGFAYLYGLRIETGDVFPAYSSLRADPLGTRAFYDSLAEIPGVRVDRRFQPMEDLSGAPQRTIIVAGLSAANWGTMSSKEYAAIDSEVRGGSRLVLALQADFADAKKENVGDDEDTGTAHPQKSEKPEKEDKIDTATPKDLEAAPHREYGPTHGPRRELEGTGEEKPEAKADLKHLWGISLLKVGRLNYDKGAVLDPTAPRDLPRKLKWKSDSYFGVEPGASWRVIYVALGKPVVLETQYGLGSIVVAGDAYLFSNEALLKDRWPRLLSWMVGPNTRVVFDESHLGVIEDVGVAALARRYGLMYAAGTLVLLAGLFIWRQTALFVPPPAEGAAEPLDCSHTAALEALLLRSVAPADLIKACASEWRATAAPASFSRLPAAVGTLNRRDAPGAYNAAVRALRRK